MIRFKKYTFFGEFYSAYTLRPEYLGENESGWTILGEVHEDHYTWVNEFEAVHPEYGRIYGDFEKEVYAQSKKALDHFIKHHPPSAWDYGDI